MSTNMYRKGAKSTDMFLPAYAGLMVFLLIVVMVLVDKDTPKLFMIILIGAYLAFIWFYLWRQRAPAPKESVPSLREFH